MWMYLEEGEGEVGGRREVFWAVVGVGLCNQRKGWSWMAGEGMMTFSFLFVGILGCLRKMKLGGSYFGGEGRGIISHWAPHVLATRLRNLR